MREQDQPQRELSQVELEQMIDLDHPLVRLAEQIKQVKSMIGERVGEVHVDMGYRGHVYTGRATVHVDKRRRGRTPRALWRWMKRRAAVEPSIGHLKVEHRLERNRLKGVAGDALNAILSAAAMNFQKLVRAFWRSFPLCLMRIWSWIPALQEQLPCQAQSATSESNFFKIDY